MGSELTGLQAALMASRCQAAQSGGAVSQAPQQQHQQQPHLALMDQYWAAYLTQLQLMTPQPPTAPPGGIAPLPTNTELLKVLSGGAANGAEAGGPSGLSAPKAVRATASSPLDDLAAALRMPAVAAAMPPASGASVFSMPGAGAAVWSGPMADTKPFDASAVSPTAAAAAASLVRAGSDGLACNGGSLMRAGSDGVRRGGSRAASGAIAGGIATGRRTGKRVALEASAPARDSLPLKKRQHAAASAAHSGEANGYESGEEGAEMALMRMRSGGSRCPIAYGATNPDAELRPVRTANCGMEDGALSCRRSGEMPADSGGAEEEAELRAVVAPPGGNGGPKCSKEKNRQAQRRFRERQKKLIGELRESVQALQGGVDSQAKQIFVLQEENRLLKMLLQERQPMQNGSGQLPMSAPLQNGGARPAAPTQE